MSPSDRSDVDRFFAFHGVPAAPEPGPACLSDEQLAGYVGALLPAADRLALESHALDCALCHELLQTVVDVFGDPGSVRRPALRPAAGQPASVRVVARLLQGGMQRGLELINAVDLVFRTLAEGGPAPALGVLRRAAAPTSDLFVIRGPGCGLDELELQVQTDGTSRLTVRSTCRPELAADETLSLLLEVDGAPREKRPFSGEPISFAPIGVGEYAVRLVARTAGEPARTLAEASLHLSR